MSAVAGPDSDPLLGGAEPAGVDRGAAGELGVDLSYKGGINGEGSVIDDELRNIPEVQQKSEIGA